MVRRMFLALAYSCFLAVPMAYAHDEGGGVSGAAEKFFPDAARSAIEQYQGEIIVRIPKWINASEVRGRGFLFHKDGWVISAAHIFLDVPRDVLLEDTRIMFRGEKAVLRSLDPLSDVAILKTDAVPQNFNDVRVVPFPGEGTFVYALMQGSLRNGSLMLNFSQGLFVSGRVAGFADVLAFVPPFHEFSVAEFIYVAHSVMRGFSGSFYVNADGEFVGMAIFIDGGFTGLVSAATIQKNFEFFLAAEAAKAAQQAAVP